MSPAADYSFTIVSTIGYGTFTPHTSAGQVLTLVFGLLGIGLFGAQSRLQS
jgi:hypothetical protein